MANGSDTGHEVRSTRDVGPPLVTTSDSYRGKHLLKELRWWDGFVLALAVPIFLFPDLGTSIVKLGALAAIGVWLASVIMGALQSNIYSELSTMMPNKSGSIAGYAHEAFKRYTNLAGPIAGWGYWFGWCVVLAINGLLLGDYIRAEVFPTADPVLFPKIVGTSLLLVMMVVDVLGLRLGKTIRYLLGFLTLVPVLALVVVPFLNGSFHPDRLQPLGLPGGVGLATFGGLSLVFYWMYIAGWSSYAFEAVAIHAPEYKDTLRDTPRALRSSSLFSVLVYGLVPLALIGALGQQGIAAHVLTPFDLALKSILGSVFGSAIVVMVLAALILSANMAAIASVRALWQMSENGLTVRGFSRLNRWGEPDAAILFTYGFNIVLIWTVGSPLWILAASNVGYILSHVVALAGFVVLRRDRPEAVRPIRLGAAWVYVAGGLAILNLTFMVVGAPVYGLQPLFAGLTMFLFTSLVLYALRRFVEDRRRAAVVPAAAE